MQLSFIANVRMPTEKAHGVAIAKMCEAFVDVGLEVELLVPKRMGIIDKDPFVYYNVKELFKIKYLPCIDLLSSRWVPKSIAFLIESITFSSSIKQYFTANRPDIIYSRDEFVLRRLAGGQNLRLFWELHAVPKKWWFYKNMAVPVSGFVVLTGAMKKMLKDRGIDEEKIFVAPDAVDLKSFEIDKSKEELRKELGLPINLKLVTYVGQLETMDKEKGVKDLLSAFRAVQAAYPASALCLVGGPKKMIETYRKESEKLGLTKTIFVDYIEPKMVPAYELASDILVMPFPWSEHYAYFMSPLKMFEYMASGRSIVATDLPSIREILDEGTAVIVKPGDSEDLARGILKLLRDEEAAAYLAANARATVKNYSWEERAKKILKFINKI